MPPDFALHAAVWFAAAPADPPGSSVLVAAILWLQHTLLGPVATTVAVIAVATVGLMMLSGRVGLRYGATVIAGCFVLFGASAIVAGIQSFAGGGLVGRAEPVPPPPPPPPLLQPADPDPAVEDPYAGASVPGR